MKKACPKCRSMIDMKATRCPRCTSEMSVADMEAGYRSQWAVLGRSLILMVVLLIAAVYWLDHGGLEKLAIWSASAEN